MGTINLKLRRSRSLSQTAPKFASKESNTQVLTFLRSKNERDPNPVHSEIAAQTWAAGRVCLRFAHAIILARAPRSLLSYLLPVLFPQFPRSPTILFMAPSVRPLSTPKSKTKILSAWLLHSSPASASTLYSRVFFTWPVAKISCGFVLHRFFCFAVSLSKLFQMVSSLCLHLCFLSRIRGCDFRFCMLLLSARGLSLRHATLALLYIVTSGVWTQLTLVIFTNYVQQQQQRHHHHHHNHNHHHYHHHLRYHQHHHLMTRSHILHDQSGQVKQGTDAHEREWQQYHNLNCISFVHWDCPSLDSWSHKWSRINFLLSEL